MKPYKQQTPYVFYEYDHKALTQSLSSKQLVDSFQKMLLIRHFENRAESAYQHGFIGGFFHSYIGQEAIQTAAIAAFGLSHWYITTYRCHALALLLGATPNEIMAELYGRATGNALGRGGSMHLYTDRLLGGFGIVGGQIPIATGAAFSVKYLGKKEECAICFMGDGAVAQGAFHESLNLASLWDLPCIYIIENNIWGMGTHVDRAVSFLPIADKKAASYYMKGYTLDGMNFFSCYAGFQEAIQEVKKTSRPVLIEVVTERFKGHSVSDPGLYRNKEELKEIICAKDPITLMKQELIALKIISEKEYENWDKEYRQIAIDAMHYAENSPWPDPATLEEGVFAP